MERPNTSSTPRAAARRWLLPLLTFLSIAALCALVLLILQVSMQPPQPEPDEVDASVPDRETTVQLAFVGDISISDTQLADARTENGYDFSPSFFGAAAALSDADLTVANLECILAGAPYGSQTLSAPDVLADTLAGMGIDLLQTANSTAIVGGMTGLNATIAAIERTGMAPVGTFASPQARKNSGGVTIREVNGVRVAFIAFTKGLNNMSLPERSEYAVHLLYSDYDTNYKELDSEGIVAAMDAAKQQSPDLIIALVHWGSEYSREISSSQKRVAKLLYDNGADAIIGTHSHLVGPVEAQTITLSNGTSKDVLTAYGLGNFYTDSTKSGTQTSLALKLTFTRNPWTGKLSLTDWSYTPLFCADLGEYTPARYQVLDIENAIRLYEEDYVYRVPDSIYAQLKSELAALPDHITPPAPEDE